MTAHQLPGVTVVADARMIFDANRKDIEAAGLSYIPGAKIPFVPCKPGSKEPATRHGFKDATTDPSQIRAWWTQNPDCNLAIAALAVSRYIEAGPAGQSANSSAPRAATTPSKSRPEPTPSPPQTLTQASCRSG